MLARSAGAGKCPPGQTLKRQAVILGGFVALIWLLERIDIFLLGGGRLAGDQAKPSGNGSAAAVLKAVCLTACLASIRLPG